MRAECVVLIVFVALGVMAGKTYKDGESCTSQYLLQPGYSLGGTCYRSCEDWCLIGTCYKITLVAEKKEFNVCIFSTILSWLSDDTDDPNIRISRVHGLTCFGSLDWSSCKSTWILSGTCVAGNCYADCTGNISNCNTFFQKCIKVTKDGVAGKSICTTSVTFAKWRTFFDYSNYEFADRLANII